MTKEADIVIVGSGIAGSLLAIALGKIGCKTLVIERGKHPRFSIGESTVPSTTMTLHALAEEYEIPEFRKISHYLGLNELGIPCYPKGNFWFGVHKEGQPLETKHEIMFESLPLPYGPDVHAMRSELDTYLVSLFDKYGVEFMDETSVTDFHYDKTTQRMHLTIEPGESLEIVTHLVIDASGHRGLIANKENLVAEDVLRTSTRTIFGHFEGVPGLDTIYEPYTGYRIKREGGTSHHCFDGGWIWVIPFNNGITSVGLMLDTRKYPINEDLSPEEEMQQIIGKFPSVKQHLGEMKPIRPLVRTGRVQFTTKTVVGDGYLLTPHASGFVDPLYSSGILLSVNFISRVLPMISKAHFRKDFSKEQFASLDDAIKRELHIVDMFVDGSIRSFRDYDLYKQYMRIWATSNLFQVLTIGFSDPKNTKGANLAYGSRSEHWVDLAERMYAVVCDENLPTEEAIRQLQVLNEEYSNPFNVSNFTPYSDEPCLVTFTKPTQDFMNFVKTSLENVGISPDKNVANGAGFMSRIATDTIGMRVGYTLSKLSGKEYSQSIDDMFSIISSPYYEGSGDFYAPFTDLWNARYLK